MHNVLLHFFDYFNTIILLYFVFTNGMYTVLMLFSLYSVTLHARRAAWLGHERILDSPATPPVAASLSTVSASRGHPDR